MCLVRGRNAGSYQYRQLAVLEFFTFFWCLPVNNIKQVKDFGRVTSICACVISKLYGETLWNKLVPMLMHQDCPCFRQDCFLVVRRVLRPVCIYIWYPSLPGQIRQCIVDKRKHNTPSGAQSFCTKSASESAGSCARQKFRFGYRRSPV